MALSISLVCVAAMLMVYGVGAVLAARRAERAYVLARLSRLGPKPISGAWLRREN